MFDLTDPPAATRPGVPSPTAIGPRLPACRPRRGLPVEMTTPSLVPSTVGSFKRQLVVLTGCVTAFSVHRCDGRYRRLGHPPGQGVGQ